MSITAFALRSAAALLAILALDALWLGLIAKKFYATHIGSLMRADVQWWAAILFYCIYAAGIVFFVVQPALAAKSLRMALLSGAAFGFVAYATYDLTNLAVLKGFPLQVAVVDLAWGTVLTALAAAAAYLALR